MELIVGDRVTAVVGGTRLPVEDVAQAAIEEWTRAHLPGVRPGEHLRTRFSFAQGSEELRRIYAEAGAQIASNDTCGASGHAPATPTEELVLGVERFLNSPGFKGDFPDTGQDVKVLGVRHDRQIALTVAMPLSCLHTGSERAYFKRKDEILDALRAHFAAMPLAAEWRINCLDRAGLGTDGVYLTLTGTSAEDADSGQVGRGNRVNGIIAFARPAGAEAAAGKNPVAHAGKVYSVLSYRLAALIHRRCPELREVTVHLSVRIGEPVDRPWTGVQVILPRGMSIGRSSAAWRPSATS
jgi:S-adenosylmethionine synthetase